MSPFRYLGLTKRATIVEIKRAYAAKLKQTRPDDDAAGFQRLHEAYQAALEQARHRDLLNEAGLLNADTDPTGEHEGEDASVDLWPVFAAPEPAAEIPAMEALPETSPPAEPALADDGETDVLTFDFARFIAELHQAADGELPAFQHWLDSHPDLYSLSLKDQLAWPLMEYLASAERPLLPKWLAALLHFFRLDTVGSRSYELDHFIEAAQQHAERYWRPNAIAHRYRDGRGSVIDRLLFRELQRPLHAGRRVFVTLVPGLPTRIWEIAAELNTVPVDYQQRVADPEAVQFWLDQADPSRIGARRAIAGALQILLVVALICLLPDSATLALPAFIVLYALWWLVSWNRTRVFRKQQAIAEGRAAPGSGFDWRWLWLVFLAAQLARLAAQ